MSNTKEHKKEKCEKPKVDKEALKASIEKKTKQLNDKEKIKKN